MASILENFYKELFHEDLFPKSESELLYEKYFGESEENLVPDEIETQVRKLNGKGYKVKYASPGHENTSWGSDKNNDRIINGKFATTARIIFSRDYKFKNTPKGWEWKVLEGDSEKKALYVKPYSYNEKLGSKDKVFKKWREFYLSSLTDWIDSLPKAGSDEEQSEDEDFSAS